jgi:phage terminase large subunit
VKEKYSEWGPGHPLWESRVLGNFPQQSEDALLSLSWLEQAKLRADGDGDVVAGLDVAGPGEDETVLCVRQGPRIILLRSWAHADPRGDVLAALLPLKGRLKSIHVDVVGIGYYMAQHLRDAGLPVHEVNVGEAPRDKEKYLNLKAELFWQFRQRAMSGELAGLTDEKSISQLAGIRYSHNNRGQIVIESKADARKRGVKSPDRAEAVILSFADVAPVYGVLEFYRQQAEQSLARSSPGGSAPVRCPQCGSSATAKFGHFWTCRQCRTIGMVRDSDALDP